MFKVEGNFHLQLFQRSSSLPIYWLKSLLDCVFCVQITFFFSLPGFWPSLRFPRKSSLLFPAFSHIASLLCSAGVYFHRQLGTECEARRIVWEENFSTRKTECAVRKGRFFCVPYIYDILRSVSSMNNRILSCVSSNNTLMMTNNDHYLASALLIQKNPCAYFVSVFIWTAVSSRLITCIVLIIMSYLS